ncbi:CoA transferase [Thalassobaculum sp. OXR-137]|uniref:CaiB/BaiF CoA transferase family protein n=1 Tax=Thalassobaculum sp. OXR-137 TaxID=3100173 RepID=UPI002AC99233|nr:CoA transferase [Thalassobaculum sp. OXR-137]WPZ34772.1 CoA transferase [Thalassobaculum sp. OXR-137]
MAGQPLEGVRILAVEQYGAGPFGTMYLANQGAEVIKVENPADGGDMARAVGPYFFDDEGRQSQFFHSFNLNKRSVALDLRSEDGRRIFRELAATADAVTNNLRGDVPEKLGIDYASLKDVNPKIVCAHLSAYGRDGSRKTWPGYDYLMQAEAGWFSVTGEPGTPPSRFGLSVVDLMTGVTMAFGVTSAILQARQTGEGRDVDVSLFDLALHTVTYLSTWYLNAGHVQDRLPRSAHPSLTPCQTYKTRDGWIYLMCNKEKFWPALCQKIGRPELATDPRFATFKARLAERPAIQEILDDALSAKTTAEWMAEFGGTVPASPILDIADAMDNPFVAERDGIHDFAPPPNGAALGLEEAFRMVAHPIRNSGSAPPKRPGPELGGDTDGLLAELGYGADQIAALRKAGAVG